MQIQIFFRRLLKQLIFLSILIPVAGFAAQVELTQGDRISGEVVSVSTEGLYLKSPVLGGLTIPLAKVAAVNDAPDVQKQIEALRSQILAQESMPAESASAQQKVITEATPSPEPKVKYTGRVDVGGNFTRGNSEKDTFAVSGELQAKREKSRTTYGFEFNEASSNDVTTTANRLISGQHDLFLNERDYAFASLLFEQDKLADLDLRTSLGGGLGRDFWNNDQGSLSGEVGFNYVQEQYALAPDESFPSLKLALKYKRKLWSSKIELYNNVSTSTNLEQARDTLFKNRFGLRFPISEQLSLSTQFNLDYDNEPAPSAKKTDTTLIFGLGYGF